MFAFLAGMHFWLGKMCGRQYPEWIGKLHFGITFIGFNLTFFPQHFLGLQGMPRRYPDYADAYAGWNMVSSLGAYISFAASILFIGLLIYTLTSGRRVGENYWGAGATTLEWTVPSPPHFHTFDELPEVREEPAH